jgi:hypothetical protein
MELQGSAGDRGALEIAVILDEAALRRQERPEGHRHRLTWTSSTAQGGNRTGGRSRLAVMTLAANDQAETSDR